jgi:beta-lactamase regulating signal transducer with metallopeptidase domain
MHAQIREAGFDWVWFALDLTAKGTLLLLVAASMALLLRSSAAAVRHWVWSLTFAALLVLPLATFALPGLSWQVVPSKWQTAATSIVSTERQSQAPRILNEAERSTKKNSPARGELTVAPDRNSAEVSEGMSRDPSSANELHDDRITLGQEPREERDVVGAAVPATATRRTFVSILTAIWLAGAAIVLFPLVTGIYGNLRLRRGGWPIKDRAWQDLLEDSRRQLGLARSVTLIVGAEDQMPMTFGWLRPFVVLPAGAIDWPEERRRVVLLHELAHVKRCDVLLQMVARLACALYWFHPLIWWSIRQMRLDREHSCDDCVLLTGAKASNYASQLLEIARAHRVCSPLASAALSMARRSQLEGRLLAVLDAARSRAPITTFRTVALSFAAIVLVIGLGVLRPAVQAETPASVVTNSGSNAASASGKAPEKSDNQLTFAGRVVSPDGKPANQATVELGIVVQQPDENGDGTQSARKYYRTTTDADGNFRFEKIDRKEVPSTARGWISLYAASPGFAVTQLDLQRVESRADLNLQLHKARTVRVQFVDLIGNAVAEVQPRLVYAAVGEDQWISGRRDGDLPEVWPKMSRTDTDGYSSIVVPANSKRIDLSINDERFNGQELSLPLDSESVSVALKPAQYLRGKVVAASTGEAIADARVRIHDHPTQTVQTNANGEFRVGRGGTQSGIFRSGETEIYVYPPRNSPYLFQSREWKWPADPAGNAELTLKLDQGVMIEGEIFEKGSNKPVAGAAIYYEQRRYENRHYRDSSRPKLVGAEMRYRTDENGKFKMPVWPGPGFLFVMVPSNDYLHVMLTDGDKYYGKPGLEREYYHGVQKLDIKPGELPPPLKFELQRGVTLRRKVLRPDGEEAGGVVYARSYLQDQRDISAWLPSVSVEKGKVELPGFDPTQSNPLFFYDREHHCGVTVSPAADEIDSSDPPIQLEPCGSAKFRFVTDKGEALSNFATRLQLVVTPGAPATKHIEPDKPIWIDSIIWDNVVRPAKVPKTDADGRVIVEDLIPGASYQVYFSGKDGWDAGYEFVVRAGETVDVGDITIPTKN